MRAGGGIGDLAVARQLIGLLAVFAATLPVPLTRDAAVSAALTTAQAQDQGQTDDGTDRVCTARMLFGATCCQHIRTFARRAGAGEHRNRATQRTHRNPGDTLGTFGPPLRSCAPEVVEAVGPVGDVVEIGITLGDRDVREPQRQRQIRARRQLQMYTAVGDRPLHRGGPAWVCDHQPAGSCGRHQMTDHRRHGLGDVAAEDDDALCRTEIGEWEGQSPIQAERLDARGRGRTHAEAAVVVDVRRTQCHPGELAQLVSLFVGQSTAAEDPDRVSAVLAAGPGESGRDDVERVLPRGGRQDAVAPHQRSGQAVGVAQHIGSGPTLLTQTAPIGGELPRRDHGIGGSVAADVHRTLQTAIRAVCGGPDRPRGELAGGAVARLAEGQIDGHGFSSHDQAVTGVVVDESSSARVVSVDSIDRRT